jgi:hypothetical protein
MEMTISTNCKYFQDQILQDERPGFPATFELGFGRFGWWQICVFFEKMCVFLDPAHTRPDVQGHFHMSIFTNFQYFQDQTLQDERPGFPTTFELGCDRLG